MSMAYEIYVSRDFGPFVPYDEYGGPYYFTPAQVKRAKERIEHSGTFRIEIRHNGKVVTV